MTAITLSTPESARLEARAYLCQSQQRLAMKPYLEYTEKHYLACTT